ncbi:MAG: TetR/AcrR family transcriptional regulator [Pseudomonadota bacterium]
MQTKGERTRAQIIERTAALMNRQGFLSTSIAAVIETTGIQKGGLYRHFDSRETLAYAAMDFAVGQIRERFLQALQGKANACDQLLALLAAYGDDDIDVPMAGGCPIMNSAIEADHAEPGLRQRAQVAMAGWHSLLVGIVQSGQQRKEIAADVDGAAFATVFIAAIEGGVMLTQLYADAQYLRAARRHLEQHIAQHLRPQDATKLAST